MRETVPERFQKLVGLSSCMYIFSSYFNSDICTLLNTQKIPNTYRETVVHNLEESFPSTYTFNMPEMKLAFHDMDDYVSHFTHLML